MQWPEISDFAPLFLKDVPLLDVRAPIEYSQGAFIHSDNVPLLNDQERQQVGRCYKQQGHDAAVALGARLIDADKKAKRVEQWTRFITQNPNAALYCFRGGLRSQIAQQWIEEATGIAVPRIIGGYKSLRNYLINQTQYLANRSQLLVVSGPTGSGKTSLLRQFSCAIDLENLANHRGSSIGHQIDPQPTQANFENEVAVALMKQHQRPASFILLEDESPNIGSLHIPLPLFAKMKLSPSVSLSTSIEERVENILNEYVTTMLQRYQLHESDPHVGFTTFSEYLLMSLTRVQRRLGGQRFQEIHATMQAALEIHRLTGSTHLHRDWISRMLKEYYDPMYDYQRQLRKRTVKMHGDRFAVGQYIEAHEIKSSTD